MEEQDSTGARRWCGVRVTAARARAAGITARLAECNVISAGAARSSAAVARGERNLFVASVASATTSSSLRSRRAATNLICDGLATLLDELSPLRFETVSRNVNIRSQ
jgi:hypothetical protein